MDGYSIYAVIMAVAALSLIGLTITLERYDTHHPAA